MPLQRTVLCSKGKHTPRGEHICLGRKTLNEDPAAPSPQSAGIIGTGNNYAKRVKQRNTVTPLIGGL